VSAAPGFITLPDLASRQLGGSVVFATDDLFAEKENLITPGPPAFAPDAYGPRGKVYDGWETRRRRGPDGGLPDVEAHDWVICRLGQPGVVRAVVVDTAFFTGNYPRACSVDACFAAEYPSSASLPSLPGWVPMLPESPLAGDSAHVFPVSVPRRFNFVRLNIFPDGGVARFRVHGTVVPPPGMLDGLTVDLAALENGADVVACSDAFYSTPRNALSPGLARVMGEGWETRRRREPGHEWFVVRLAAEGVIRLAEIDTSGYRGNAPFSAAVSVAPTADGPWQDLLGRVSLQPDTVHRFRVDGPSAAFARLSIYPDGGIARLRLRGSLTPAGFATLRTQWQSTA